MILNLIKVSTTASERLRSSAQTGIDSGAFALQEPSAEMKASFSFGEPQRVARRERILCLKQFVIAADTELFRITGTDLTQVDGIDVVTATTILSEAGWDMSPWKDEDHFVSWLRLCPDNRISGNKVLGKGRLPTNNRASIALKMAASTLRVSNTYPGAQFRRFRTKLGAPVAIKAMAAKLARLVYRMLRYGMKYVDQGAKFYEAQHRERQITRLKWKAAKLGFHVVEAAA